MSYHILNKIAATIIYVVLAVVLFRYIVHSAHDFSVARSTFLFISMMTLAYSVSFALLWAAVRVFRGPTDPDHSPLENAVIAAIALLLFNW